MAALRAAEVAGGGVVVLEAAREPGRKILVSGGGRCNVLPAEDAPSRFVSESPGRLVRRFLARWPLSEQRAFFETLLGGPLLMEPGTGKLFAPTNRARDVRDALRDAALRAGVTIRPEAPVRGVALAAGGGFLVRLDSGDLSAGAVVLATGGRSVLAGGADAAGLVFAQALGHTVRPTYPALAPLVGDAPAHHALAGVSLRARVTVRAGEGTRRETSVSEGGFLFTHRGWSGPAVLDVSHVVERARLKGLRFQVTAAFPVVEHANLDDADANRAGWVDALRSDTGSLLTVLRKKTPDRLASLILETAGVTDASLSQLSRADRGRLVETLTAFPIPATGTEGYRTAEVTGGGVALEEVDPGSGESKLVPGLFLAGEILDAFGPIGGFNFQWAWATGRTAGGAAARRLSP